MIRKAPSAKRSFIMSLTSLIICVAMLLGTTFAWFSETITSGVNTIKSGNLDVDLQYAKVNNGQLTGWNDVNNATEIFDPAAKWEPGYTEVIYLKLTNLGSLAIKYKLGINISEETAGTNVYGDTFKLSDYIKFGVVEVNANEVYADREEAIAAVESVSNPLNAGYTESGSMENQNDSKIVAVVVYMPETVGNEANYKTNTTPPMIKLGINLVATQDTVEMDSFDNYYDAGAAWLGDIDTDWYFENPDATSYNIYTPEQLAGLAALVNGTVDAPVTTYAMGRSAAIKDNFKGKTINLCGNINLNDIQWTPIGDDANPFLGNFDGQGYTVSNLFVSNAGWAGLIGHAGRGSAVTVKNVNIDGATILSNRMAGAVVGQIYGDIDNCHVENVTVIATPNAVGDSFDNGDKVGAIAGWLGDNGNNRTISNCSATNVELGAYRDVGGIVGYVATSTTVSGNTVENIKITVDQRENNYGDKDVNAGYIYGRTDGTITEENNTKDEDSKVDSTYYNGGLVLKADGDGKVALYLVPEEYQGATVNVPEGVTTIGNYAFAYNANVETVILPSTVRDLGRGFDSSTVKKVVLNEGLEVISSRAFRSTTALEEVVFSSTVKVIEDNAFQKSGIKEIVIPATVETVGETAFGASLIETVTFEGNTAIQGYAFRGCTKLRTVNLYGEDITFIASTLNGRNSCWFCNGESNNPNTSNITFTVRSDEMKERVLTAMGAERNNTPVIVDDGFEKVESVDALLDALTNATAGTKINATGLTLNPTGSLDTTIKIPAGVTIKGANFTSGSQCYLTVNGVGDDVEFVECNFDGPGFGMFVIAGSEENGSNMIFENCTFRGQVAPNFVQNTQGKATFNNCTFTVGSDNIGLVNCMGGTHTFNNCTFDYTGGATYGSNQFVRWNAVNSYSESFSTSVILSGCTFKNCGTQRFGGNSTLVIK